MDSVMHTAHSNARERLRIFIEHRHVQGVIIALILINVLQTRNESRHE